MLAEREDLFAYLGGAFLWEGLAGVLAARARELAHAQSFPPEALQFINDGATEESAPADVLLRRIETRTSNEYGKTARNPHSS